MKIPNKSVITFSPTSGVVSLTEVNDHLSLFGDTTFDDYLTRLIAVASVFASNYIGESLETSTVVDYFDGWDSRLQLSERFVDLTPTPIISYVNNLNTPTTLSTTNYIDRSGEHVAVTYSAVPSAILSINASNPISITYGSSNVDKGGSEAIKQAVLMIIQDLFNDRADNIEGSRSKAHVTAERLLAPYRRNWI